MKKGKKIEGNIPKDVGVGYRNFFFYTDLL